MLNIKEVLFGNKKKKITFFEKEDMIDKIERVWLNQSDREDNDKKQKAILKYLPWFQKVKIEDKELFVEKSDNPLVFRNQLIKEEKSNDSIALILLFSIIPIFLTPITLYVKLKNEINKKKVKEGKFVYITNIWNNFSSYATLFLVVNLFAIVMIVTFKLLTIHLTMIGLNIVLSFLNIKAPYLEIKNYELADFKLEEQSLCNDSVESKIMNMPPKEIRKSNNKIEYDFLNDEVQKLENTTEKKIDLEKEDFKSIKKYL